MICTLHGTLVEAGLKDVEDRQTGVRVTKPFIVVYSEGETRTILGLKADGKKLGETVDVTVSIKMRTWDGRSYLSVKPID